MAESAREQVAALAAVLESGALKLATAESCTGGWIAKVLTDRAGSSAWFEYGVVTYGNNAKQKLLGVTAEMLEERGAVSEAVACRMAEGALALSGADIALAVTGIAGPDGGSPDKPVGTVWFAWAQATSTDSECCVFEGDRTAVRWQTVQHALAGVLSRLE